jgi:hypothetical protein
VYARSLSASVEMEVREGLPKWISNSQGSDM